MAFCTTCGTELTAAFCGACGQKNVSRVTPPLHRSNTENVTTPAVNRWNWGAFLLPELWPFWHGLAGYGVAVISCDIFPWLMFVFGIHHFGFVWLASWGIRIFLGIRGGRLAVQRRAFADNASFEKVERLWANWAAAVVLVPLVAAPILIVLVSALGGQVSNTFSSVNP